jgi:hypothetical protein
MKRKMMKIRNEDLHNFYFSPDIISVLKLRKMRWAVHAWGS